MKILTSADRVWLSFVGVGFSFAAIVGLLAWLGHLLDERLGCTPWLLILGGLAGVALATWDLIHTVSALEKKRASRER